MRRSFRKENCEFTLRKRGALDRVCQSAARSGDAHRETLHLKSTCREAAYLNVDMALPKRAKTRQKWTKVFANTSENPGSIGNLCPFAHGFSRRTAEWDK